MEYLNEWDHWLAPIVPNIPEKDIVIRELKQQLNRIFQRENESALLKVSQT